MLHQIGRFSIPSGWGARHSPIIGEMFNEIPEAESLKEGTVYVIVSDDNGALLLAEVGPSALETKKGGAHYLWLIEDLMTDTRGAYVKTKDEVKAGK